MSAPALSFKGIHMPKSAAILVAIFVLAFIACPALAGVQAAPCVIINEYPHDVGTSTQGLFYLDGVLYESSGGYNKSFLAKVELATGKHLLTSAVDTSYFAEGIAPFGDKLRLLTWKSGTGFIHSMENLHQQGTFTYRPVEAPTEGWGLTLANGFYVLSTGTDRLYFHSPESFTRVGSVEVHDEGKPVRLINELEFVDEFIYANIWKSDIIVVIDSVSGDVVAKVDLSPLRRRVATDCGVANGIAYDEKGGRLFVTGKHWDKLFEIEKVHLER